MCATACIWKSEDNILESPSTTWVPGFKIKQTETKYFYPLNYLTSHREKKFIQASNALLVTTEILSLPSGKQNPRSVNINHCHTEPGGYNLLGERVQCSWQGTPVNTAYIFIPSMTPDSRLPERVSQRSSPLSLSGCQKLSKFCH